MTPLAIAVFYMVAVMFAAMPSRASITPIPAYTSRSATSDSRWSASSADVLPSGFVRLPGHVLSALTRATRVKESVAQSRTESLQPITLTIVLKRDDQTGFDRYLRDVYDPHSKNFRRFLTQAEISDRFGPSQNAFNDILAYMHSNGFSLLQGSTNRMTLTMRGTRADAERAFDLRIGDYRNAAKEFYANEDNPALPAELASRVQAVNGLTNFTRPRPATAVVGSVINAILCDLNGQTACNDAQSTWMERCPANKPPATICEDGYTQPVCGGPKDGSKKTKKKCLTAAKAKNEYLPALPNDPASWMVDGTGQTIGLLEFDAFHPSDVQDYLNLFGLPTSRLANLSEVKVNGGATAGVDQKEVLLDIDTAMILAPGAKVVVYDAPFEGAGGSFQPLLSKMIADGVSIISNSWAYCEDQTTAADAMSIDTLLKTAAASGISVFNGAGDTGSTCLDGATNTIGVPADSPNATAVGGSSITDNPAGFTYSSENWWDGAASIPATGQGGFGTSKFFSQPSYQNALGTSPNRSIPDVVINSDPANGYLLCEADAGGCPNGLLYGGTSVAAPMWAAFAALLNQAQGTNLGFLNPLLYPLADGSGFHDAASMGSDFAHVGLGSPNLNQLHLLLTGQTVGIPSTSISEVETFYGSPPNPAFPGLFDDGASQAVLLVTLRDSGGNVVGGKTVSMTANAGSHAVISPPSGVSSVGGSVAFTITNATFESSTFTATDITDGVVLSSTPTLVFAVSPATAAGIGASPSSVAADGTSATTITVTLKDALSRPTPGKLITLAQGNGHSIISGPNPSVTDSTGVIQFTATDVTTETVPYTATDVTDGNLPVPGSAPVMFTSGAGTGCSPGPLTPSGGAPFTYTNFITGFPTGSGNCLNPSGMAFDASGNMYVADYAGGSLQGGIYKFPPSGGVAGPAFRLNATGYASFTCASGLAFSKDGKHLYLARQGCNSGGDVVEVSTTDGSVIRTLASIACASGLATDPISGDLFVSQPCPRGSSNIVRISNPDTAPTMSIYSTGVGGSGALVFTPDGTLWTEAFTGTRHTAKIEGTNSTNAGSFTYVANAFNQAFGVLPAFNSGDPGNPPFLLSANALASTGSMGDLSLIDLTVNPPVQNDIFSGGSVLAYIIAGPDGCAYASETDRIIRITKADGSCPFAASSPLPSLALSPSTVMPNPLQGESQTLTATLANVTTPAGTPVQFSVTGANPTVGLADADANGQASFTYTAIHSGEDQVIASATAGGTPLSSNQAQITWDSGKDVTFLTLNPSPKGGTPGMPVMLVASLTDISQHPAVPVVGQSVTLKLGNDSCAASTDVNGIVKCAIASPEIIPGNASRPLTASFAGTGGLTAATASAGFLFSAPAESVKLTVSPKTRSFPSEIELGGVGVTSKPALVTVSNPMSKKQNLTVTFLGAGDSGDFAIISGPPTTCNATLAPKAKCVIAVTFTPTAPGKRIGSLTIADNAALDDPQIVKLQGTGKQGKPKDSPASLSFAKQAVKTTSAPKTVNIGNPNPLPMTFAASISGDFAISSDTCASTLPPNASCAIGVTFTPTAAGAQAGALTLTDTAVGSPQTVKLTGAGM